ncbi:hypothetical protein Unana1_04737 [Umbelopsis nana]
MLAKSIEAQEELVEIEQQISVMELELKNMANEQSDNSTPTTASSSLSPKTDELNECPLDGPPIISPDEWSKTPSDYYDDINIMMQNDVLSTVYALERSRVVKRLLDESIHGIGAQLYQIDYEPSSPEKEWTLALTKNGLRIETNIKSVQDLMHQVQYMAAQMNRVKNPALYSHPLTMEPNNTLLIKFGKKAWVKILEGNRKALHRCVVFMQDQALPDVNRIQMLIPDVSTNMTLRLLQVYFSCQHLKQLSVHRKTFNKMFFQQNDIRAPVYALCAAIVTMRCKHVLQAVPYESQLVYGEYYFNLARDMYSEQFDDLSIEAYCTLAFMAMYKVNLMRPSEAENYLSLAKRIGQALLPNYSQISADPIEGLELRNFSLSGEAEMFKRLMATCNHLTFMLFLLKHPPRHKGEPHKEFNYKLPHKVKHNHAERYMTIHGGVHPRSLLLSYIVDESASELRYIQQSRYVALLREVVHSVMSNVASHARLPKSTSFMIATCSVFEQNMRNWYHRTLPKELQVALPLFDDSVSDATLIEAVAVDRNRDSVPLSLLISFYHEYVVVMKKVLPRLPQYDDSHYNLTFFKDELDPENKYRHLHERHNDPEKRERRRKKLRAVINELGLNCTERELHDFYHTQFDIPQQFQIDAQDKCTRAANLTVRLLEQLTNSSFSCQFHLPSLMCTWDMHLRNSRLGHAKVDQPDGVVDPNVTRQARQNLVRCLSIMRRGYLYNTAERELWRHYQLMEQELLRELSLDPAFKVTEGPEPDFSIGLASISNY